MVGIMLAGVGACVVMPLSRAAGDQAARDPAATRGTPFTGTAAVGALFTSSDGHLGSHFCTASVVDSKAGDLAVTAAHCVDGKNAALVFAPDYANGKTPYGLWPVTKVYVDRAWSSGQSQDDDIAFIRIGQPGSTTPIEDVTGAETLATKTAVKQLVEVIGYPDGGSQAITCENWTSQPMADQLQFDCGGYTDGTSGGPFLADVNAATGQGTVIGIIGGLDQGGYTPQVSYSIEFEQNVADLYKTAVAGG